MRSTTRVLALACVCSMACGSSPPPSDPDARIDPPDAAIPRLVSFALTPPERTLVVENHTPITGGFRAIGTYDDGDQRDITDEVIWDSNDATLATLTQDGVATASAVNAGETQVVARFDALVAYADLTVIQRIVVIEPSSPPDAPELFEDAGIDPAVARAPGMVYPNTPTVLPPNFAGLEIHYIPGMGNDLFELTLSYGFYEYRHYTECAPLAPGVCRVYPTIDGWTEVASKARGSDLQVRFAGLLQASPSTKAPSGVQSISLTVEDLTAGLYYWAATDGKIHRFDFGHAGVPPEPWYPVAPGDIQCAACHSLSRDGSLAAVDREFTGTELIDVATRSVLWEIATPMNRTAFSPDNTMLLSTGSVGGLPGLRIVDVATGLDLGYDITTFPVESADWSPDGSMIVAVSANTLYLVSWDGTSFGEALSLTYGDFMNAISNPAFTPDSRWILFNKGMNLYMISVDASPGTPATPLGAINLGLDDATWCKVSPTFMKYGGGEVAFLSFSSHRPIGFRPGTGNNQIWFAAFDPARATAGLEPTFLPIHLPWQAPAHANHIAQWALQVVYEPCGPKGDCPTGYECQDDECIPTTPAP